MSSPGIHYFTATGGKPPGSAHTLAYHEWPAREGMGARVLFCVHGLTRNAQDFAALAPAFLDGWRVIAVDLPGRGRSEWLKDPADYNYSTYVADVVGLLDHLDIRDVDWVGTSLGGIVGMMVAGLFPGRIGRLVLNDVGARISAAGLRRILSYAGGKTRFASRAEVERALRRNFAGFGIRTEANWQRLFSSSLVEEEDGRTRLAYDPAIVASSPAPEDVQDIDLEPVWEKVHCPTLILRGAESDILTRATAQTMRDGKSGVTVVEIPGAGHAPSLMEPDQIAPIVRWLSAFQAVGGDSRADCHGDPAEVS
jgi:pimeloyl-ACP methyl ester carboxylesterase